MKVDGKAAEPGDEADIGVTGSMSVDSYTQFNQAGTVSITNGAYAQLVSSSPSAMTLQSLLEVVDSVTSLTLTVLLELLV